MKRILTMIILCVTMAFTGCATVQKKDDLDTCYDKPPLNIEHQEPLKLLPITGQVIRTEDGLAGVLLSGEDFNSWILNNKSIESYIRIDKATIDSYHQYYIEQKDKPQPVRDSRLVGK